MTCSEDQYREAAAIVDRIIAMLDDPGLEVLIDDPIDQAAADFEMDTPEPPGHGRFHELIGDFVHHVYVSSPTCPRKLSVAQARCEAVSLLEQDYQGTHARGYHAAVLDVADPDQAGLQIVLVRLAEIIKTRQRQTYTQWALARHIDPADWQLRCAIAAVLLQRYGSLLSPGVQAGPPARWIDLVPELLQLGLAVSRLGEEDLAYQIFRLTTPSIPFDEITGN